mgnify:CR=1 FL=1
MLSEPSPSFTNTSNVTEASPNVATHWSTEGRSSPTQQATLIGSLLDGLELGDDELELASEELELGADELELGTDSELVLDVDVDELELATDAELDEPISDELELGKVSLDELELEMLSQQSLSVQMIMTMISCNAT